jgi:small conductance mechanosensitive channel
MDMSNYLDMALLYASEYGLKIIAALLIFFIGKIAVRKTTTISRNLMLKAKVDHTFVEFLESIVYFVL